MDLLKTEKETLTPDEVEAYIQTHERDTVPTLATLWEYYKAKDEAILRSEDSDPNNPNNKLPVPYGRKIVTTFTGYAYRPHFITYKPDKPEKEGYVTQLQATFDLSNEAIKTSRAGRNTAIYGVAYELLYLDGVITANLEIPTQAEPRFFTVDPREMILLYDYSPEPKKQIGIRYYPIITDKHYRVEVYERSRVSLYDRRRTQQSGKWVYSLKGEYPNFFGDIPVVPYYFGDDRLGIIKPVLPLIDAYDKLTSGGMDEFERFANAYLLLVKMGLVSPENKKEPGAMSRALRFLKKFRVFEHLPDKEAVSFLTKNIPTEFLEFMSKLLKTEIHTQSHVPDFREMATGTLSGAAIKRLLFDFENVASSAEADFDTGLYERIRLINMIYGKTGRLVDSERAVVISHKRNLPDDLKEAAETAVSLKNAGFSAYLIADTMPDSVVPDVDEELARQEKERKTAFPDVEANGSGGGDDGDEEGRGRNGRRMMAVAERENS